MRRIRLARPANHARPSARSMISPVVLGLGILIGFPTVAAYQDMTSMMSGLEGQGTRWAAYVERSVAGSVHAAEMPFANGDDTTGSIRRLRRQASSRHRRGRLPRQERPIASESSSDESRVNRAEKRDRVVTVVPVAPPKAFNAGSVFQRSSSLLRPSIDGDLKMAFVRDRASPARRSRSRRPFIRLWTSWPIPRSPATLAELVNNDKAGRACHGLCAGRARLRQGLTLRDPAARRDPE